MLRSAESQALS